VSEVSRRGVKSYLQVRQKKRITPVIADRKTMLLNRAQGGNLKAGEILLPSNPSAFKTSLAGKSVIVKISLFSRAFSGTVIAVDETGFCFVSEAMISALRETTGTAMAAMDAPSVYLTFASLEWLVSNQPKAAAATA
jgi:hypothetical protein